MYFLPRLHKGAEKGGGRSERPSPIRALDAVGGPGESATGHHGNRFTLGVNGVNPAEGVTWIKFALNVITLSLQPLQLALLA